MQTGHHPILASQDLHWADEAACERHAAALAQGLLALHPPGDAFIALQGPLGAGKTTFVRHLLRALGVAGRIKSPSYGVLELHEAPGLAIAHFDFYRFSDAREWADAGFRDVFAAPGLKLAEWPQHAAALLPRADLSLALEPLPGAQLEDPDGARRVRAEARSAVGVALLKAWPA